MRDLYHLPDGGQTPKAFALRGCALYVVGLLTLAWGLTQAAAHRLGYAPALGAPWIPGPSTTMSLAPIAGVLLLAGFASLALPRTRRLAPILLSFSGLLYASSRGPLYFPVHGFVWASRFRHPLLVRALGRAPRSRRRRRPRHGVTISPSCGVGPRSPGPLKCMALAWRAADCAPRRSPAIRRRVVPRRGPFTPGQSSRRRPLARLRLRDDALREGCGLVVPTF